MLIDVIQTIEDMDFEKEFIVDAARNQRFSYNKFFEIALKNADYIEKKISGRDIIVVMENSFELALLYFSVMFTSKRILAVDPKKGHDEIKVIIEDIPKTAIICDDALDLENCSEHYRVEMFQDKNVIVYNNVKNEIISRLQRKQERLPYLVTFTSGTSGITKGVEHTLDNLFLTALALDKKVQKRGGTFLHVMPMTYMAGILNSLIYPFLVGARIIIDKRFSIITARNFWNNVIKYNVDLFWLSPSMLMMIDQMDRKKDGEEYCRNHQLTFLIGTAPLTNELRTKFNNRYGVNVFASYGLSETLFISVETSESLEKSEKNSVGEVLTGVEYLFTEENEIYIKVPWMYIGYTNENTDQYFDGEYYKSGDLAEVKNGYLYITGRNKDLIIKGGMNISPVLIENEIYKNKSILENVVIGVKDANGEEKICCVYHLKDNINNEMEFESGLKKMVIEILGKNYAIDYFWNIDSIPRNINGKIDKNKLKSEWVKNNGK